MTTDNKIRDEKLEYNIDREAAKISVLSSEKIDKYEYLTGEEIIFPNQRKTIGQATFKYYSLGKAFEKQIKTRKKKSSLEVFKPEENKEDIKSVEAFFPEGMRTNEIKSEIDEKKELEGKIKWKDLKHKTNKHKYDFQQHETIKSCGQSIYNGKVSIDEAELDQSDTLYNFTDFNERSRPKTAEGKNKKEILIKVSMLFIKV